MISKHYINSAVKIREEFIYLSSKLNVYLDELSVIKGILEQKSKELMEISNNLDDKDQEHAKSLVLNKLTEIEIEGKKIERMYKPVNEKIEKLRKQEEILYDSIKEAYPKLSDEDIINELKKYIKE